MKTTSAPKKKTAKKKKSALRPRGRRPEGSESGRDSLLRAALYHFARNGFEATSLRKLSADANVDMALAARLFGSKHDLWMAVVGIIVEKRNEMVVRIQSIIATSKIDPQQALRDFVQMYAQFIYELPEFYAIYLHEVAQGGERYELLFDLSIKHFIKACTPVIEAAVAKKTLNTKNPALYLRMLFSAIAIPLVPLMNQKRDTDSARKLRDQVVREAIENLLPN